MVFQDNDSGTHKTKKDLFVQTSLNIRWWEAVRQEKLFAQDYTEADIKYFQYRKTEIIRFYTGGLS